MSLLSEDPAQFTGTGTYVRELLRALGRRPTDIHIEVLAQREPHLWSAPTNVRVRTVGRIPIGGSRVARAAGLVVAAGSRSLRRQLAEHADVVHYPLTLTVPPVRAVATVQTLYDLQHRDLPGHFSTAQKAWRRLMYDRGARRSTAIVTISEHARGRAIETLGLEPDRVFAVPLAVNSDRFTAPGRPGDELLLQGLRLPKRFLFYPASLWPHKNHGRLIEALAHVQDRELGLVLSGATFNALPSLRRAAERHGVGDRVHHLGRVPEDALPALYRRATGLVFPSLHEGFGLPPIEAMACGCPVASSREAAMAEVCGQAAAVLDPFDPTQMADVIQALAHDGPLRERLRGAGFARARQFTWDRTAEGHVAVYTRARELHGA